ncbi:MAG: DUF4340 domain-containing protein [Phycisphaerae bacterium]|nr:DUF4340 domain-containing protein [Phycisphaerae bacterium]
MRGVRTIVALAIAAALGAGWWALRDSPAATSSLRAPGDRPVFGEKDAIPVDEIDAITLRRGDVTYELRRTGTAWRQTAPVACDIDPYSARQFVADAASLLAERAIDSTSASPAAADLVLRAGPREWRLEFGKRSVAGRAFVRRPGGPILVVRSPLYERAVEMDPREWRSRFLFPESLGRPTRLVWQDRTGSFELARDGERWTVRGKSLARADQPRVEELLSGLARARSDGFLVDSPADLATFGLAEPIARLTVEASDAGGVATTRTLEIGAPLGIGTNDRYARLADTPFVFRLGAGTQTALLPRPGTLIEPTGSGRRPADVKRIEVRPAKGDRFELVRELDRWTISRVKDGMPGPAVPCNSALPERLLKQLCLDRAPEIAVGPYPAEMEQAQVLFFGFDEKPLDVVRIAKDTKTGKWGLENGDSALRVFPASTPLALTADEFGAP